MPNPQISYFNIALKSHHLSHTLKGYFVFTQLEPSYSYTQYIHGYILYPTFPPTNKVASVHKIHSLVRPCPSPRSASDAFVVLLPPSWPPNRSVSPSYTWFYYALVLCHRQTDQCLSLTHGSTRLYYFTVAKPISALFLHMVPLGFITLP